MPRLRSKPVKLTAQQRIQSAQKRAQTFRELAERMNPDARARLLEKAAHWAEVARIESEGLDQAREKLPAETVAEAGPPAG